MQNTNKNNKIEALKNTCYEIQEVHGNANYGICNGYQGTKENTMKVDICPYCRYFKSNIFPTA